MRYTTGDQDQDTRYELNSTSPEQHKIYYTGGSKNSNTSIKENMEAGSVYTTILQENKTELLKHPKCNFKFLRLLQPTCLRDKGCSQ